MHVNRLMPTIWEHRDWSRFRFDIEAMVAPLLEITSARSALGTRLEALGLDERSALKPRS